MYFKIIGVRNISYKSGIKIMINPTIKKILILNSVLLIMILALLIILNWDVLMLKISHKPSELFEPGNENNSELKYYTKQDSLQEDFEKLKNDTIPLPDEIIKTITAELEGFNWNEEFNEEDLHCIFHETIFAKQFPSDHSPQKDFVVITFSNHDGNFYHAATGRISLFEFEKDHLRWRMRKNYLAFGNGDEYGFEPLDCELIQIGNNNKYAVIVHTSYSGQGHEKESKAVYTEVNESFDLVFDFTSYEYYNDYPKDIEYTDGYSEMRIPKSNKNWFDIETKSEDIEWNDKTPDAVKRFTFNGEEYVEVTEKINNGTNSSHLL